MRSELKECGGVACVDVRMPGPAPGVVLEEIYCEWLVGIVD